jgi:hypothetical protein
MPQSISQAINIRDLFSNSFFCLSFKCNRTIQITGLGLYGRSNGRDPNVKVCVIVSTYDEVAQLESCNKTSGLPEGGGMFDINFCKPVTLNENTWYTITISMEVSKASVK